MSAKAIVLGASVERVRDYVRVLTRTDKGSLTLLFSEPLAADVSRKLGLKAAHTTGQHRSQAQAAAAGAPLLKPGHSSL